MIDHLIIGTVLFLVVQAVFRLGHGLYTLGGARYRRPAVELRDSLPAAAVRKRIARR